MTKEVLGTAARALSEIDALREFFHLVCREFWDACEVDGATFEDIASKCGLIRQTKYDPAKHGEYLEAEPGDPIWEKTGLAKHADGARAAANPPNSPAPMEEAVPE